MPLAEMELEAAPSLADRVALVRAQLEPIRSRGALLESYRRESLCRLAATPNAADAAAEVLELAYAMRWLELDSDPPVYESDGRLEAEALDG